MAATGAVTVSTSYKQIDSCDIVLPDMAAVHHVLGMIGNYCGASESEVRALITMTECIAQQSPFYGGEVPIESWGWGERRVEQAHKTGLYTSDISWANGLNYHCWSLSYGRIHMADIRLNNRPVAYSVFGGQFGVTADEPIAEAEITIWSSVTIDGETVLTLKPLFDVTQELLREACVVLTDAQREAEAIQQWSDIEVDPYQVIESSWQFARALYDAYKDRQRLLNVCEDSKFYEPRYGDALNQDGFWLGVYFKADKDAIGEVSDMWSGTFEDSIRTSTWQGACHIGVRLAFAAKHPYEASNNGALRAFADDVAQKLRRAYALYEYSE